MQSLIKDILNVSSTIDDKRNRFSVMAKVVEEVGEISTEVAIAEKMSYKKAGVDGIVGEAVDAIIALTDLIYVDNPNITEEEIQNIVRLKLQKWVTKNAAFNAL